MELKNRKQTDEKDSNKVDTRYYDELFKKIKDDENNEFNDPEALEILYNNIIEQIAENDTELKKCLNSFHIDFFIYKSNLDNYVRLFDLITQSTQRLEEFLSDRRISRAYEACLIVMGDKVASKSENYDSNINTLKKSVSNLASYLKENFEAILENQNGIFALRSFLRIIGQPDVLETPASMDTNKKRPNRFKKQVEFSIKDIQPKMIPNEWKLDKYIKKLAKHLQNINVLEIGLIPSVSPCISLLLRKLYATYPNDSANVINSIHEKFVKKPNSFKSMIQDSVGSRFIESYLYACPTDLLVEFYINEHLVPNIVAYSNQIYANYSIQTLIKHRLHASPEIKPLYDAILENLGSIIDLHTDLIYKNYLIIELMNAAHKTPTLELKELVKALMDYFGCNTDENKIHFLKVLLIYEKLEDILKESSLEQALFSFDLKPIASTIASKLIEYDDKTTTKSFNNLTSNELEMLCTSNVGSHFIQNTLKIFNSKDRSVWLQNFFDKLKGRFLILTKNKSGSFVMETIWSVASLKQRIVIVDELKSSEVELKNDWIAKFFVNNIGLNFYKRKPDEWKDLQNKDFKKRKMFSDLFDDKNAKDSSESNDNENKHKKIKTSSIKF